MDYEKKIYKIKKHNLDMELAEEYIEEFIWG
jgi:hypothetical protein